MAIINMDYNEKLILAQQGQFLRENSMQVCTAARQRMLFQKGTPFKAQAKFQIVTPQTRVVFLNDMSGDPILVKDLDNIITTEGKQLIINLLETGKVPNSEENKFLLEQMEKYEHDNFKEINMKKHRRNSLHYFLTCLVLYSGEKVEDLLIEILSSLNKCKALSHHHKTIPVRNRMSKFIHKTYRHERDKELQNVKDQDAVYEVIDNYMDTYINPGFDEICKRLDYYDEQWLEHSPSLQERIAKMGMSKEIYLQFFRTIEFCSLFYNIVKEAEKQLHDIGFSSRLRLDNRHDSMIHAIDMMFSISLQLFDNTSFYDVRKYYEMIDNKDEMPQEIRDIVDKGGSELIDMERKYFMQLFNYENVVNAEQPGLIDEITKQRVLYKEMRKNHPDWNEATLYKEFFRLHPEPSVEKRVARQLGSGYRESVKRMKESGTWHDMTQKEYAELWKNLCKLADETIQPYIEEDNTVLSYWNKRLKDEHPEFTDDDIYDFITEHVKVGVTLHPTATYDVLHSMLRFEMPSDVQDYIKKSDERRILNNAKRKAKRAEKTK